jgi:hypothetical protein
MDIQDYPRSESVRSRDWKYIRYFKRTPDLDHPGTEGTFGTKENYLDCLDSTLHTEQPIYEELYHLAADPYEEHSLASNPQHRTTLDHMRQRILTLLHQARAPQHTRTLPLSPQNSKL